MGLTNQPGRRAGVGVVPWSRVAEPRVDGKAPLPTLGELVGTWPEVGVTGDSKTERYSYANANSCTNSAEKRSRTSSH